MVVSRLARCVHCAHRTIEGASNHSVKPPSAEHLSAWQGLV